MFVMSTDKLKTVENRKKAKKLYRCPECTNSVTLSVEAEVICTRCNVAMRLFEAKQTDLFAEIKDTFGS